jgi:hypothetical protein
MKILILQKKQQIKMVLLLDWFGEGTLDVSFEFWVETAISFCPLSFNVLETSSFLLDYSVTEDLTDNSGKNDNDSKNQTVANSSNENTNSTKETT